MHLLTQHSRQWQSTYHQPWRRSHTEQAAIFIYMADLDPEAGLSPPIGDPLHGPYLRWLVFYGASIEPAVVDKSINREPAPPSRRLYGDFDTMLKTLTDQLAQGPYILSEKFTAADVLWGTALNWTTKFKLVPELPLIRAYVDRVNAQRAFKRAQAAAAELMKRASIKK